jgi:hypothetical protein
VHPVLQFALLALVTYRVTRLLVVDNFPPILWVRDRLAGDEDDGVEPAEWVPDWLSYLAGCYWCMSVWVSGAVTLAVALTAEVSYPLLVWGGVAAVAPLIQHVEKYLTRDD